MLPLYLGLCWKIRPTAATCPVRHPYSLYPNLAAELQQRLLATEAPEPLLALGSLEQVRNLSVDDQSQGGIWAANAINQSQDRLELLGKLHQKLKPGGWLFITDDTRAWAESMWPARLARRLGKADWAEELVQRKLKQTGQNVTPDQRWWQELVEGDEQWELVRMHPFFSRTSMLWVSIFESLNYKQGGPSPDWLNRRIERVPGLSRVYRSLVRRLTRRLADLDPRLTRQSGGTSLLVVLRRLK